jgi:hypothetical protein
MAEAVRSNKAVATEERAVKRTQLRGFPGKDLPQMATVVSLKTKVGVTGVRGVTAATPASEDKAASAHRSEHSDRLERISVSMIRRKSPPKKQDRSSLEQFFTRENIYLSTSSLLRTKQGAEQNTGMRHKARSRQRTVQRSPTPVPSADTGK